MYCFLCPREQEYKSKGKEHTAHPPDDISIRFELRNKENKDSLFKSYLTHILWFFLFRKSLKETGYTEFKTCFSNFLINPYSIVGTLLPDTVGREETL